MDVSKYCLAVLLDEQMELGADEKYFLTQLMRNFGVTGALEMPVKEAVYLFGLSEAVYLRCRDLLIEKQVLNERRISATGKGRLRKGVVISPGYLSRLEVLVGRASEVRHMHLINELLSPTTYWLLREGVALVNKKGAENQLDSGSQGAKLRPSTRVLMCVLLAHSSPIGIVQGLGHSDFRKLVGMKRDRLVNQISKLREIGFVRFTCAGLTGSGLFGVTKSDYLIDLGWRGFKDKVVPAQVSIYIAPTSADKYLDEASAIFNQAKEVLRDLENVEDVVIRGFIHKNLPRIAKMPIFKASPELRRYFSDMNKTELIDMLQWRIELGTSQLLSEKWGSVIPNREHSDLEFDMDFIPNKYVEVDRDRAALADLMSFISYSIAKFVRSTLADLEVALTRRNIRLQGMDHLLIPKAIDRDLASFCLFSYPKKSRVDETSVVVIENTEGEIRRLESREVNYTELPEEVIRKYNL